MGLRVGSVYYVLYAMYVDLHRYLAANKPMWLSRMGLYSRYLNIQISELHSRGSEADH